VYPQVRFPAFIEDGAEAVRWTLANIAAHGGDPDRLALLGHSAGAHIAAMLAINRRFLGRDHARVRALAGLAGPYDFLPLHSDTLRDIFGPEPGRPASQPINFVAPGAPPTFLAVPGTDTVVDPGNMTRLAARLQGVGASVETTTYARTDHATILGAFSPLLRPLAPVLNDTVRFIRSTTNIHLRETA
jgi:acetyl esterase/lipase